MELDYVFVEFEANESQTDIPKVKRNVDSLCEIFGFRLAVVRTSRTSLYAKIAYPRYHFFESDYATVLKLFLLQNDCSYIGSYSALSEFL